MTTSVRISVVASVTGMFGKSLAIDRPIFMMGPGRSGSTLIHNLITIHRDLAFFSSWSHKYPAQAWLALGANLRRVRPLEKLAGDKKGFPRPTEAYDIWKYCIPDFWKVNRAPCQDAAAADKLRRYIATTMRVMASPRFIAKTTGPPLFDFLSSIFPDAKFVWIDRDPRAVAYSFYDLGWLGLAPDLKAKMTPEQKLEAAAARYLGFYRAVRESTQPYLWIQYERFVDAPAEQMQKLTDYVELRPDAYLAQYVREAGVRRTSNERWRNQLTDAQQGLLDELLREPLRDQGYA